MAQDVYSHPTSTANYISSKAAIRKPALTSVSIVKEKGIYFLREIARLESCRCTAGIAATVGELSSCRKAVEWLPGRNDVTSTGPTRYRGHRHDGR